MHPDRTYCPAWRIRWECWKSRPTEQGTRVGFRLSLQKRCSRADATPAAAWATDQHPDERRAAPGGYGTMNKMSVATFDTLAAVRNLEKAGMGTSQAEAVTETIRVAVFQGVATKEDVAALRSATSEDIAELRAETKADIAALRADLNAEIGGLRGEMKADIGTLRADFEKFRADMTWRMVVIMGGMLGLFAALDLFFLN